MLIKDCESIVVVNSNNEPIAIITENEIAEKEEFKVILETS